MAFIERSTPPSFQEWFAVPEDQRVPEFYDYTLDEHGAQQVRTDFSAMNEENVDLFWFLGTAHPEYPRYQIYLSINRSKAWFPVHGSFVGRDQQDEQVKDEDEEKKNNPPTLLKLAADSIRQREVQELQLDATIDHIFNGTSYWDHPSEALADQIKDESELDFILRASPAMIAVTDKYRRLSLAK